MNVSHFFTGFALLIFAGFLFLSSLFIAEGSWRASFRSLILAILLPVPYLFFSISANPFIQTSGAIVTFVTIFCLILLVIPLKGREIRYGLVDKAVIDERDTMFSRKDLQPGTKSYDAYYLNNPEKEIKDNIWRAEPGLLSPGSLLYNKLAFAAADASFDTVKTFSEFRDKKPEITSTDLSGLQVTEFIKEWSKKLGAAAVGFTEMKDYHYYTVAGRDLRYGSIISKEHPYGIVFLTEMDFEMVMTAPHSPVVMESSNQYLRSAAIATQVAVMIRKLGYRAKTHIDANYDLICPLVARDSGLGEIGRNGMLISDEYGPRVRISVITTDLPVKINPVRSDSSVLQFCAICKKCALNCPAQSIPSGPMENIGGTMKWQLNQESCYTYWNHTGTDCGRCLSSCPYSHPNTWFHNIVRRGIRNNIIFLYLSKMLDNYFYGKRPSVTKINALLQ